MNEPLELIRHHKTKITKKRSSAETSFFALVSFPSQGLGDDYFFVTCQCLVQRLHINDDVIQRFRFGHLRLLYFSLYSLRC